MALVSRPLKAIPRRAGRQLVDDALVTAANPDRSPGQPLRTAAISALAFTALYVVHRLLQGTGPDRSTAAAVATYQVAHRGVLVASEVAVGLALLAFIPFLAGLVPVIWRAGQESLAVAVAISGGVFVAMGFVSNAAETALIWVADANQPAAGIFLLGSVFSILGQTPEGSSSVVGVGLFVAWMLALSAALWRAASTSTTPGP
jgi:hypothetical protein